MLINERIEGNRFRNDKNKYIYIYVRKHRLIAKNTKSITLLRFTYTDENNKIRLERQFSLKIISAKEAKKKKHEDLTAYKCFQSNEERGEEISI